MDEILRYFPDMPASTREAFSRLGGLYADWNSKINVISRADIDNIYTRHILHSLAIAAFLGPLKPGTSILDLGTGGGFPGIPLALIYPEVSFHLIDRIGKKIRVASEVAKAVGLDNVTFQHGDAGECRLKFDYVVSRAVMPLDALVKASTHAINRHPEVKNRYQPGIVCLKGGDLSSEIEATDRAVMEVPVTDFFSEPFFQTKEIVYVPF